MLNFAGVSSDVLLDAKIFLFLNFQTCSLRSQPLLTRVTSLEVTCQTPHSFLWSHNRLDTTFFPPHMQTNPGFPFNFLMHPHSLHLHFVLFISLFFFLFFYPQHSLHVCLSWRRIPSSIVLSEVFLLSAKKPTFMLSD